MRRDFRYLLGVHMSVGELHLSHVTREI